jgi:hypothetical protein
MGRPDGSPMGRGFRSVSNDTTEGFVQEVHQRLREEQLMTNARKYAPMLIGAVIVLLLAVGGWQLWQGYQLGEARKGAVEFSAAQQLAANGDMDRAKAAFLALTTHGPQTYRTMARLEYGAILALQGDLDPALHAFDQAAAETGDPTIKQTAQLRAAYIAAETQDFDTVQRRLQPIIDSHSRLSYLAQELLAVQAWKAGKYDLARSTLETVSLAFSAPQSVRDRAQEFLSVIGPAPAQAPSAANAPAHSEGGHQ